MKNFLILGLLALLLFSVSAGLSLWLNQSKQSEADKAAEKDKEKEKLAGKNGGKHDAKESHEPRPLGKPDTPPAGTDPAALAKLRDQESRNALRAAQIEVIMKDIQSQRDAIDDLLRKINSELKANTAKAAELETAAAELERKKVELGSAEKKNIEKMASWYDAMAPESAAPILKQMADSGRMDMAVKILAQMKERQAAKVLAELADPALAAQLLDKMRTLKPAPAVVPAGGTGGPTGPGALPGVPGPVAPRMP